MRVMMLASGDLWAGAEVMVCQLARGLLGNNNVELLVVVFNQGRLYDELERAGIAVEVVDEARVSFWGLVKKVGSIVRQFSPHVIHSHRYKENLLSWLVVLMRRKVRLVSTQHGMPEITRAVQSPARRLRSALFFRLLSCCFQRTVAVSCEMKQALAGSYGFFANDITVIHNGISLPDDITRHSWGRIVVGSAGRLFPVKDFSLLVEVARNVIGQNEIVEFVLAGDGPERTMLEDKVRDYGMEDRFRFSGHVDDMEEFYRGLDVYINTSVHEGIPMSVLEAMSHGLPVVVPNVGGFPEIVEDGESGFLVVGRDPVSFSQRIMALLPVEERQKMGKMAKERVENHFSQEAMARKYFDVYQEIAGI